MIVDSSALLAIVLDEPSSAICLEALLESRLNRMSAATFLEAAIVADRHPDRRNRSRLDQLIAELGIDVEPVSAHQATIAREAYRRFGKGSGHPAKLNFGDCFAYALAQDIDEPLLFVGQDIVHTDVRRVLG
ncbi:MAG: type II toxin-antitoxin system VapC family toxin [Chloroflexia bacterium]|nr:type II toxin-antitoxin system VapC family toxin [Chloroflexia bacterium]